MISITVLICALGAGAGSPVEDGAASVVPNAAVSVSNSSVAVEAMDQGHLADGVDAPASGAPESEPPVAPDVIAVELPAREHLPLGGADAAGKLADKESGSATAGSNATGLGVWQTIMCTGGVVALILGGRWFIVRTVRSPLGSSSVRSQLGVGGRAPSGLLFVLGRYPVSRGASLVLIQLDRRVLLLSQSGAGFQTLAELRDPEEVASIISKARDEEGESISARFSSLMRSFDKRHADTERAESLRAVVRPIRGNADGDEVMIGADGVDETPDAVRERLTALRALVS